MNQLDRLLRGSFGADSAAVEQLRASLTRQATSAGLIDVAFRTVDTPVGVLLVASTPLGLVRVAYDREGHDTVLDTLAQEISPRILSAPEQLDQVARQLDDYFARRRRHFDLPLDLRLSRGFRATVLRHLSDVDYGQTVSYADIASAVGSPRAVRAVGTACATNPLPVLIPCHRVLRSDGTVGGYIGGPEAKRALLALERPS